MLLSVFVLALMASFGLGGALGSAALSSFSWLSDVFEAGSTCSNA